MKQISVCGLFVLNKKLIELSKKFGIPLVATNDNHYIKHDDAEGQEILLCIGTQTTIDTPNRKLSMMGSPVRPAIFIARLISGT